MTSSICGAMVRTWRIGVMRQTAEAITDVSEYGISSPPAMLPEITAPDTIDR